ncbi:haloacid dehalogenase-like hydrolase [Pistricoccus aurantiacus]|uniref:haloacid dehalogenase-like hydrolase n=1 Tax=Pistricoccus aurantiacus TaxID=1883414 RepID=UPI00363ED0A0
MITELKPNVYIVDVCGTLVRDDTTLGLLRHHFARDNTRPLRKKLLNAISNRRSPLWFAFAVAEKISRRHLLKHFAVYLLAGDSQEALNVSANEYAKLLLAKRKVPTVWPLLEYPMANNQVVLASASLEPVVAALAELTNTRYVASTLEQHNGILTGRYATDLTGIKKEAIVKRYGKEVFDGQVCVVTDNFTDRPLMEGTAQVYIVLHDAAHRERWNGVDANFIGIDA